jgi:hypothetical protein
MTEWKDEDEVTITFGTLRQAMREAAQTERERISALLNDKHTFAGGKNEHDESFECVACDVIALVNTVEQ